MSRLVLLPSDRFIGFVFLSVGFMDLSSGDFDLEAHMAVMKAVFGNEIWGYWTLFLREDCASVIEGHVRCSQYRANSAKI